MKPLVVFTIGHSTRTAEGFIRLLKAHGVQRVIDVRTILRLRHNPQFDRGQLSPTLHRARFTRGTCLDWTACDVVALRNGLPAGERPSEISRHG